MKTIPCAAKRVHGLKEALQKQAYLCVPPTFAKKNL